MYCSITPAVNAGEKYDQIQQPWQYWSDLWQLAGYLKKKCFKMSVTRRNGSHTWFSCLPGLRDPSAPKEEISVIMVYDNWEVVIHFAFGFRIYLSYSSKRHLLN